MTGVQTCALPILVNQLSGFELNTIPDQILWRWTPHRHFTVHSFYSWLDFGGVPNREFQSIWGATIPLKIKIFLWLVKQNRVLTRDNLSRRGWSGNMQCVYCSEMESVNHLFVNCHYAGSIWAWIATYNRFVFVCDSIVDLWELDYCIPLKDANLVEIIRGAVL